MSDPRPTFQNHTAPLSGLARQHAINNAGLIHRNATLVLNWLGIALAISVAFMRLVVRFKTRRRLFTDDYLVVIAVVMLIGAAATHHMAMYALYLSRAIVKPNSAVVLHFSEIDELLRVTAYSLAFAETCWTAIFCIKFSFLSLFHTLIRNRSAGLTRYYWGVVVLTVLSWCYMMAETPLLCPYFGAESLRCKNGPKWAVLITLAAFLDIVTDLLIISFPILILRKSLMDKRQKFWVQTFLSLSVCMIILAFFRILGSIRPGENGLETTWQMLWQLLEACVGVMAASACAMRSAFMRKDAPEHVPDPPQLRQNFPMGFSLLNNTVTSEGHGTTTGPRIPLSVVKRPGMTVMSGVTRWRTDTSASSEEGLA